MGEQLYCLWKKISETAYRKKLSTREKTGKIAFH